MFQGQGAGSLLTRQVLKRAEADKRPVYLESTPDAVHMYESLGFKKLDIMQMNIPRRGDNAGELTASYVEVCMVRWPDETSIAASRA